MLVHRLLYWANIKQSLSIDHVLGVSWHHFQSLIECTAHVDGFTKWLIAISLWLSSSACLYHCGGVPLPVCLVLVLIWRSFTVSCSQTYQQAVCRSGSHSVGLEGLITSSYPRTLVSSPHLTGSDQESDRLYSRVPISR